VSSKIRSGDVLPPLQWLRQQTIRYRKAHASLAFEIGVVDRPAGDSHRIGHRHLASIRSACSRRQR
jgi:hypothetical protein